MTFDDFLNMCSLFNEQCPRDTKIYYAFHIYGELKFNNRSNLMFDDNYLTISIQISMEMAT